MAGAKSPIIVVLAAWLVGAPVAVGAGEAMSAEAFLASLTFRQGHIRLPGGMASLSLPRGYRYLSPGDAERVLVSAWGNPPGNDTLGMILGGPGEVLARDSWAVVVAYEEDGHVSDADAEDIDQAGLLAAMQAASRASNATRLEAGFEEIELVGWAVPPRYDRAGHALHWAKELRFGNIPVNTLNYNLRILGRRGVLVLNLIATMPQLEEIESLIPEVLSMASFDPGHRYADFDPRVDQVAAYGVDALIAGTAAVGAGLPAGLRRVLAALEELWIVAVIVLGAGAARVLRGGRPQASPIAS